MIKHQLLKRFWRDQRGATLVEFAFVAPSLLLFLLGSGDFALRTYLSAVLQGEVEKAGRDATVEGSQQKVALSSNAIDSKVRAQIGRVMSGGTFVIKRKSFETFTQAGQGESFTDTRYPGSTDPFDGVCNHGESFQDDNNNGFRDSTDTSGKDGQGGARDITVYTVTFTYPRLFPMASLLGWTPNQVIKATTVLRNQPFGVQATGTGTTGTCP